MSSTRPTAPLLLLVFPRNFSHPPRPLLPTGTLLPHLTPTPPGPNQMLRPKALLGPGLSESTYLCLAASTAISCTLTTRHLNLLFYIYAQMRFSYTVRSNCSLKYLAQYINHLESGKVAELVNESANHVLASWANSPNFAGIIKQFASVRVTLNTQAIKLYPVYCVTRQKEE